MNPNQPQYPAPGTPPAPAGAGRGLTFAMSDVIVGGAAFLFFIFSFTPFLSSGPLHTNLWNYISPLGWWAAVANVLLLATAVAALRWARDKEYVGFRRSQVQVALGLYVFLFVLGILFAEHSIFGWGGWLMLICSLVALAGAVLGHLGLVQDPVAIPTGRTSKPAAPAGYQAPPTGYQAPPAGGYAPPQAEGGYQPPATPNYAPGQAPAQPPRQDDTI